jgi:hypothetical protein
MSASKTRFLIPALIGLMLATISLELGRGCRVSQMSTGRRVAFPL